jgi:hypothetical protein
MIATTQGQALWPRRLASGVAPANTELNQLLNRILAMPGLPSQGSSQVWRELPPPLLQLELDLGSLTLKLFSMLSTFGTPLDVTTEELRVESFFPGDSCSATFFQGLPQQTVKTDGTF